MYFDAEEVQVKKVYKLLEPGKYQFKIVDAIETQSQKGNDMFKIKLYIFNELGDTKTIYDYILLNNLKRIESLCQAIGEDEKFKSKELTVDDLNGSYGQCEINIEKGKEQWPDSNHVKFYYKKNIKPKKAEKVEIEDDILPF